VNEDAVLLRYHDKYDMWATPGGHIDAGQDANEAALREVWEEVALQVELIGPHGWVKTRHRYQSWSRTSTLCEQTQN
jgi:8-oxo-dGTP pyrophosphatase MutT (NUDIX family)